MCLTVQAVAYPQTLWMKRWAAFRRWITASRRKHNGQEVNQGAVKEKRKRKEKCTTYNILQRILYERKWGL